MPKTYAQDKVHMLAQGIIIVCKKLKSDLKLS